MNKGNYRNSRTIALSRVGKLIREYRATNRIEQTELAGYLELNETTVSQIERGRVSLPIRTVPKVAALLNIPQNELTKMVLVDRGYNI